MKWKSQLMQIKQKVLQISEYWYIGMLVILTVHRILVFACLDIVWADLGKGIPVFQFLVYHFLLNPNKVLFILVLIRHICAEKYNVKEILCAVIIYYITAHAMEVNHYDNVMTMVLLMLGAWGISFQKLIKIYFITVCVIVAEVVLASQLGFIENMMYQFDGRKVQMAFGFSYPTRFASHVFFLILWYWFLRDFRLKYAEAAIPVVAGLFVWFFCDARMNVVCLFSLAAVMIWQTYSYRKAGNNAAGYRGNSLLTGALALSPVIASAMITVLTVVYTPDHTLLQRLNVFISNRLSLTQKVIDIHGVHPWGKWIRLAGNGGFVNGNVKYLYIDSAFMQFSIQYGVVILVMLLILFCFIGIRGRRNGNSVLLWILMFVSLHAIIEPQLIELQYCPLLFAAFADLQKGETGGSWL